MVMVSSAVKVNMGAIAMTDWFQSARAFMGVTKAHALTHQNEG
jgi:hypothetical protein